VVVVKPPATSRLGGHFAYAYDLTLDEARRRTAALEAIGDDWEPCYRLIPMPTAAVAPGCRARAATTAGTAPSAAAPATAGTTGNIC
jgi:hypothetical protein